MKLPVSLAVIVLLLTCQSVFSSENAKSITFPQLWAFISEKSPALRASRFRQEAAEISKRRLARHWLPKLHVDSSAFNTDDPTANFINILGERQVTTQDFNPTVLNAPGAHDFTQTTVGADFSIYDGGQSVAALAAQNKIAVARRIETQAARLKQYSEAARLYGDILSLADEKATLKGLDKKNIKTISTYRLGTKANPIGYSGILALKNTENKIEAAKERVNLELSNDQKALEILSGEPLPNSGWSSGANILQFATAYVPLAPNTSSFSFTAKAQLAKSEAAERKIKAEKARYLPHVGLFAQDTVYTGDRGNASGYTAGGYLKWNFDAVDIGAAKQAKLEAAAARSMAESVELNDRIQIDAAITSLRSAEKIIRLLQQNEKRLSDQWLVSKRLFRNGSIAAAQLAEVLSNAVDVAQAKSNAEKSYLVARLELLNRSTFDPIPERISKLK